MAKKTGKKVTGKAAPATNGVNLPQSANIPAGMRQMGGGYATTWSPVEPGDSLHGFVSAMPKELTLNKGTKKENVTRVMEVTDKEGIRHGVWDSAVLSSLFNEVEEHGEPGQEVFIQYDGLGKKKPGQNAPKLFTVAIAE